VSEVVPGADLTTDDEILDWVKKAAETTYHPVGTLSCLRVMGWRRSPDIAPPLRQYFFPASEQCLAMKVFPVCDIRLPRNDLGPRRTKNG
jgi:hypothetical protein